MATSIRKSVLTVFAENYKSAEHEVSVLPPGTDYSNIQAQPKYPHNFIQQWYLSLQGEVSPSLSETQVSSDGQGKIQIYRYDWAFGVTLIRGFWWDWMADLAGEDALAVHLVLEPSSQVDAVPIAGTLNALRPSRNTQSVWEQVWQALPKAAADAAKAGASAVPALDYVAAGLVAASNIVDSQTAKEKNWFLYQFVDEYRHCPTVEWRINRKVFKEYGPLIRGALFVAFYGAPGAHLTMSLRPQVRYSRARDLDFLVPTAALKDEQQVRLTIEPR